MRRMPWLWLILLPGPLFASSEEDWFLDKPIEAVVFSGLERVAEEDLAPAVRPYVGQTFTLELFWELQGRLYAMDRFQTIEGNARPGETGRESVIVELRVTEMPVVAEVVLQGRGALSRKEILEVLPFRPGEPVSEARLQVGAAEIRDLYRRQGYLEAEAGGTLAPAGQGVRVLFQIDEGVRTTIREIRFEGNSALSAVAFNRVMETRRETLFRRGLLDEAALETDLLRIRELYGQKGYPDARVVRVEREVEPDAEGGRNRLTLILHIEEGARYTYGGMEFEGNELFSDGTLRKQVRQKPGDVLNRRLLEEDFQRVVDLYHEHGYIFNPIDLEERVDAAARTVSVRVRIVELAPAHIERILIRGNRRTHEEVITRELPFQAGDVFNKTRIFEGLRGLYASGYFSAVTLETPLGSAEGLVDLIIDVEEARTDTLNLGIRLSGGDFPIAGTVGWSDRNFLGRGQSIGAALEVSDRRRQFSAGFNEPRLFGSLWSGGAGLSVAHAMEYSTWTISAGLHAGARTLTPLGWLGLRAALGARLDHLSYDESLYRPLDPGLREGVNGWSLANRLSATVYLDHRDPVLSPSRGWYLGQGITYAGGLLLGDRHYLRTDTTVEGYLPLLDLPVTDGWNWRMVLAARSSLGFIFPQFGRTEVAANPDELLGLDGLNAARGWAPLTGKKAVWESSLELRMPIAERFLWSSLFFDAAVAWDEPGDIGATTLEDYRFSLGAGLQITAPQFPLEVYLTQSFRFSGGRVQWLEGDLPFLGLGLNFVINLNGARAGVPGSP